MHHAAVRCNYSPYSALWDKVFGTHKDFAVKQYGPKPTAQGENQMLFTNTSTAI